MIEYMSIEEQAGAGEVRVRRRAFLRRVAARLRGDPASAPALAFEEARKALGVSNKVPIGRRAVPVERIVGSVGRHPDFDRAFLPLNASLEERWKRVDRAFHRDQDLPPVVLFKVGDAYFVEDGNHRVSVARYQGVGWIDAEVVELRSPAPAARLRAACRVCFDAAA